MLHQSNISTTAVANELGVSSRNVGVLCTSSQINMWSKWKPINANVTTMSEQTLINNNYGILAPSVSSNIETALTKSWTYDRPKGGATSPYRLGDFRNYDHAAPPPVTEQQDRTWYVATAPTLTIELQSGAESSAGIQVEDLKALNGYYLAFGIYRNGYWDYQSTSSTTFPSVITINAGDIPVTTSTTYQCCLAATTDPGHQFNTGINAANWLPLPGSDGQPQTFNITTEIVSPIQQVTLTGVATQADYSASGWSWTDPSNYIGADPTGTQIDKYYSVGNTYTLQMRLSIKNISPDRYTFNTSNLHMYMSRTFATTSQVRTSPVFFNPTTHQQQTSFTVEGYGTLDIGVSTLYQALKFESEGVVGTVPTATTLIKVSFSIQQDDREIFNQAVRLSNMSFIEI